MNDSKRSLADDNDKFAFGRNWSNFLDSADVEATRKARESLQTLLQVHDLQSQRFIDAGSGSGLFSLAAYQLGATVVSFDADCDSVACTSRLRSEVPEPGRWTVLEGSLLDCDFLASLPMADVVYCWGVAHHTGDMWRAMENLTRLVLPGGKLVVAIYNDQLYVSRVWSGVKQIYQRLPRLLRGSYVLVIWLALLIRRALVTLAACLLRLVTLRNPLAPIVNWVTETRARGMHGWYDLVDWVGGWPFEVARPEDVFRFLRDRQFTLREMTTSGGHGCNEFVFRRDEQG